MSFSTMNSTFDLISMQCDLTVMQSWPGYYAPELPWHLRHNVICTSCDIAVLTLLKNAILDLAVKVTSLILPNTPDPRQSHWMFLPCGRSSWYMLSLMHRHWLATRLFKPLLPRCGHCCSKMHHSCLSHGGKGPHLSYKYKCFVKDKREKNEVILCFGFGCRFLFADWRRTRRRLLALPQPRRPAAFARPVSRSTACDDRRIH